MVEDAEADFDAAAAANMKSLGVGFAARYAKADSSAVDLAAINQRLKAEGFEVDWFEAKPGTEGIMTSQNEVIDNYDLIIYLTNMVTKSNQTVVRIEWKQPMGVNVPVFMHNRRSLLP